MTIKLDNKTWQNLFHKSIHPKTYGLEYDYGILYYKVIDKSLFFLSVIEHGLEFEEVDNDNKFKSAWLTWIDGDKHTFNPITLCDEILRKD